MQSTLLRFRPPSARKYPPLKSDTVYIQSKPDTVRIPGLTVVKYDTITKTTTIHEQDTVLLTITKDSTGAILPANGDSWPEIQAAVNAGIKVCLSPGNFYLSCPIIVAKIVGGVY